MGILSGIFLLKYGNREYGREKVPTVPVPVTAEFLYFFPIFLLFLLKRVMVGLRGIQCRSVRDFPVPAFIPTNGKPLTKMFVDGGAAVNVMPYTTFRKLGMGPGDLTPTSIVLNDFAGNPSDTKGCVHVDLMIGSKTLLTTFFVIEGKWAYSLLLGRDWIHANCCIPSTMHQQLVQWVDDDI
jgi:hypothetical protein